MIRAEIITVGTEILLGEILNTNAKFLSMQLAELGFALCHQTVVGDNESRLAEALRQALLRAEVIIMTGGLGPTEDDITRETVAKVLGRELVASKEAMDALLNIFAGREMPANNLRQSFVPSGGVLMQNPHGTAPGIIIRQGDNRHVILLPGPPREMQPMFFASVVPYLREQKLIQGRVYSRVLHFVGVGESKVAEVLSDLVCAQSTPSIALYSRVGEVDVRLAAHAASIEAAERLFKPLQREILTRLGQNFYGADECTLAKAVGAELLRTNDTLVVAESCTGGLIGHLLTAVSGSSQYFLGTLVCYSNSLKMSLLKVAPSTIEKHGAVSEACAREMVMGAMLITGASSGLAVTGIAGPTGGTLEKPVGTVWLAVARNSSISTVRLCLSGDREAIKERAARRALGELLSLIRDKI